MAVNAKVLKSWSDGTLAWIAYSVVGDDPSGTVEYLASTPLKDSDGNDLPPGQVKQNLIAAASAVRNAQRKGKNDLGITGNISI